METAPTSIEVLLRPTSGQSDEPSDLRGSLSPTSVYSTWQSPDGHPSNYEPGATLLNFSDRANHNERTPYSVSGSYAVFDGLTLCRRACQFRELAEEFCVFILNGINSVQ